MAVLTKDDLMSLVKDRIGDDTSDETLKFVEDISDTISDLEQKAKGDGVDWKQKYEENDKSWRDKYRERFFGNNNEHDNDNGNNDSDDEDEMKDSPKTFEELFK